MGATCLSFASPNSVLRVLVLRSDVANLNDGLFRGKFEQPLLTALIPLDAAKQDVLIINLPRDPRTWPYGDQYMGL